MGLNLIDTVWIIIFLLIIGFAVIRSILLRIAKDLEIMSVRYWEQKAKRAADARLMEKFDDSDYADFDEWLAAYNAETIDEHYPLHEARKIKAQ